MSSTGKKSIGTRATRRGESEVQSRRTTFSQNVFKSLRVLIMEKDMHHY